MITKEHNGTKQCCFYASDFHLEMILLPYIKQKINNMQFIVFTQNNLEPSMKMLLDRINWSCKEKEKILNIDWSNNYIEKLKKLEKYKETKENINLTIFIKGDNRFNKSIKKEIELIHNINIIDCWETENLNKNIKHVAEEYDSILNMSTIIE